MKKIKFKFAPAIIFMITFAMLIGIFSTMVFGTDTTLSIQDFESKPLGPYNWVNAVDGDTWPVGFFSFTVQTDSAASGKAMKFTAAGGSSYVIPGVRSPVANVTGAIAIEFWIDTTGCTGNKGIGIYPSIIDGDGTRFDMRENITGTVVLVQQNTGSGWVDGNNLGFPYGNIWSPPEAPFKGRIRIPLSSFEYSFSSNDGADHIIDYSNIRDIKFGLQLSQGQFFCVDDVKFLNGIGTFVKGKYAIVSNESVDETSSGSTGTLSIDNSGSVDKDLCMESYIKEYIMPFNKNNIDLKKYKSDAEFKAKALQYQVGDTKLFWTYNMKNETYTQITATLKSVGSKCDVWVNTSDYNMSAADANKISAEFDNNINSKITAVFGQPSDVDENGKVNILCFDIKDGWDGVNILSYVGGYFNALDLFENDYENPYSNETEVFYIDTYPAMGTNAKDVTKCFGTLAHEFQHMINFEQNWENEGAPDIMDDWLNEALSEAASQIYSGEISQYRIAYYNNSSKITSGFSLLNWSGEVENYSLAYLFLQYLKEQVGIGDDVFTEVLQNSYDDYRAVEYVIKKYISPNLTFSQFMTNFRAALLLKQPVGPYGFKGVAAYNTINKKIYKGGRINLYGGGAVVIEADPVTGMINIPDDVGATVKYLILYDEIKGDINEDKHITTVDALMALKKASGRITLTDSKMYAADVNGDGNVTTVDALKILQFASGRIKYLD